LHVPFGPAVDRDLRGELRSNRARQFESFFQLSFSGRVKSSIQATRDGVLRERVLRREGKSLCALLVNRVRLRQFASDSLEQCFGFRVSSGPLGSMATDGFALPAR